MPNYRLYNYVLKKQEYIKYEYTMNQKVPEPMGNRDPSMAPHGCYPCTGEDNWVAIAVASDEQWNAFCRVMGNPEWTKTAKFKTTGGRWKNQDELDRHHSVSFSRVHYRRLGY